MVADFELSDFDNEHAEAALSHTRGEGCKKRHCHACDEPRYVHGCAECRREAENDEADDGAEESQSDSGSEETDEDGTESD